MYVIERNVFGGRIELRILALIYFHIFIYYYLLLNVDERNTGQFLIAANAKQNNAKRIAMREIKKKKRRSKKSVDCLRFLHQEIELTIVVVFYTFCLSLCVFNSIDVRVFERALTRAWCETFK